jgi:hypothetical protein
MAEIEVTVLDRIAVLGAFRLLVFAGQRGGEAGGNGGQRDAAFGALRAGHRRHDILEIERQRFREHRIS